MRYLFVAVVLVSAVLAACGPTPPEPVRPGGGKAVVQLGAACGNGGQSIGCASRDDGGTALAVICVDGGFVATNCGSCSYSAAESQATCGPGPTRWLLAVEGDGCASGPPSCEFGPVGETGVLVPQTVVACEAGRWVAKERCQGYCLIRADAGASCR